MAKHLGDISKDEYETLYKTLVHWLKEHNVAGSVAQDYSLYRALDDEVEKARRARKLQLRRAVRRAVKGTR